MRTHKILHGIIYHALILTLGLVMIYPVVWMVMGSFKNNTEILNGIALFPASFHFLGQAFFIYMMMQFMEGIPKELDEAAI
jgi:ABC-type glycerol-3-phosphate transport system permease component